MNATHTPDTPSSNAGLLTPEQEPSWRGPMLNWQSAKREFSIHFEERFNPSSGWVTKA